MIPISHCYRKEETALRNIALAHKTQKDARVILENKMALLKHKARLELPAHVSKSGYTVQSSLKFSIYIETNVYTIYIKVLVINNYYSLVLFSLIIFLKKDIHFQDLEDLKEVKQTLFKQLKARQEQADKDQVQQQRKQLLKQVSLLVMSDFD